MPEKHSSIVAMINVDLSIDTDGNALLHSKVILGTNQHLALTMVMVMNKIPGFKEILEAAIKAHGLKSKGSG